MVLHVPEQFTYFDLIGPAYDPVLACAISRYWGERGPGGDRREARPGIVFCEPRRRVIPANPRQQSTYWLFLLELATAKVSPFPPRFMVGHAETRQFLPFERIPPNSLGPKRAERRVSALNPRELFHDRSNSRFNPPDCVCVPFWLRCTASTARSIRLENTLAPLRVDRFAAGFTRV